MARLDIPDGDLPEIARVWELRPEMGEAVRDLSIAVYQKSKLPPRVREAARMRIAEINGCVVCQGWRIPELAEQGVNEELYAHVEQWRDHPEYSEPERLAIEYAERFALDHRTIDDAFFARLQGALHRRGHPRPHDLHRELGRVRPADHAPRPRRGLRDAHPRDGLTRRA